MNDHRLKPVVSIHSEAPGYHRLKPVVSSWMNKRARVIVSGRVQGAAYRDAVERMAYELDVTGTVRNLDDKTVEVICEGKEDSLADFLKRIRIKRWPIMVRNIRTAYEKPTGEFCEFLAIRGKLSTRDILDRLDLGLNYMAEMNEKQDRTVKVVKAVDGNVKTLDSNMSGHFHRLNSNMSGHFGRLDRKYGDFGRTLKGAARDIKAIRKAAAPPSRRSRRKRPPAGTAGA